MKRCAVAPLPIVRIVRLNSEDIHPFTAATQLTATDDVGPVSHGGGAVPPSRCAKAALILPGVGGGVVRAHGSGVGIVDVASRYEDFAVDDRAGVAAARHIHGGFHLPLVGGGHVALHGGLDAICVTTTDGEQQAVEGVEAEVSAPLEHVAQMNPSVEAGIISKKCKKEETCGYFLVLSNKRVEQIIQTIGSYLQKLLTACLAWFLASFWSSPPATYRKLSRTATH